MGIKFHLIKLNKAIVFQILEQDSRSNADNISNKFICLYSKSGDIYRVASVGSISFEAYKTKKILYLRGRNQGNENKITHILFENNEERDKEYDNMLFILDKAFKNIDSWQHLQAGDSIEDIAINPNHIF